MRFGEFPKKTRRNAVFHFSGPLLLRRFSLVARNFGDAGFRRETVLSRDRGVCALCGLDAIALHQAIQYIHGKIWGHRPGWDLPFFAVQRAIGLIARHWPKPLWEVDHRLPTVLGGADELTNWRTLCIACHRLESARLRQWLMHHPLWSITGIAKGQEFKPLTMRDMAAKGRQWKQGNR